MNKRTSSSQKSEEKKRKKRTLQGGGNPTVDAIKPYEKESKDKHELQLSWIGSIAEGVCEGVEGMVRDAFV